MGLLSLSPLKVDPTWLKTVNSSHLLAIGHEWFRLVNDPLRPMLHDVMFAGSFWERGVVFCFLILAQLPLTIILLPWGNLVLAWTSAERAEDIRSLLTSLVWVSILFWNPTYMSFIFTVLLSFLLLKTKSIPSQFNNNCFSTVCLKSHLFRADMKHHLWWAQAYSLKDPKWTWTENSKTLKPGKDRLPRILATENFKG